MRRWAPLLVAVLLGLALAWWAVQPPRPAGLDAPAQTFSAHRALADVREIAREPHPVGSAANVRVRNYLVGRLRRLGLQVQIAPGERDGVRFENIVGRLGEGPPERALVLMAHYDSVPGSPGAADDAAGVAAILETVRALRASGAVLRRPVIVLFTDGEEAGLYGARAYFTTSGPRPAAVLNLEARGGGGRVNMFETGPGNAELVGLMGRTVASPSANSLMRFVYERMPNGTDFTPARRLGIPGLNFAFMGDYAAYHSALATPDRLDLGSLQHMGDQALALTRALADGRPAAGDHDLVYADLLGLTLVRYPKVAGWLVPIAVVGLVGVALVAARGETSGLGHGRRAAAAALGGARLAAGFALSLALLFVIGQLVASTDALPAVEVREASPSILAGFAGLIGVAVVLTHLGVRHPTTAWAGALLVGGALTVALQIAAPETAFVVGWPTLWGALTAAILPFVGRARTAMAVIMGALGLAWLGALIHLLFLGVGLLFPAALASGALLAPLVLHPLLARPPPYAPAS